MAIGSFISAHYSIPAEAQEEIEKNTINKYTDDVKKVKILQVLETQIEEVYPYFTTLAIDKKIINDEKLGLKPQYYDFETSKAYRIIQIADSFNEIMSLLAELKSHSSGTDISLALLGKIKTLLEKSWEIIEKGDEDIAFLLVTIEKIIGGKYWRTYTTSGISKIEEIISNFIKTKVIPSKDSILELLHANNIDVLPSIKNE